MSPLNRARNSPAFIAIQITIELLLIACFIGLGFWVYAQGRTQHQICQAFQFVGDSTQHGIDTNSKLIMHDMQINTASSKADAVIRRQSVAQATDFLIRVRRVQC